MNIDRSTYDIYMAFPQITDFPIFDAPTQKIAVVIRLFSQASYAPISHKFVYMALWSMRSHMLNSDMREYQPSIVFHIEDALYETAQPIFEKAGIPEECVVVFPTDICPTNLQNNALHKAVAPLVDPQMEIFDRIIVLDADSFSLSDANTGELPLMDISINQLPPDQLTLLRGWTKWEPSRDEYENWYGQGIGGKERWIDAAAHFCNSTPEAIHDVLYPKNASITPRPYHNGAYINFTTRMLKDNPEFRQFILDVTGAMGNEEIAFAVWAMKFYLESGKYYPCRNLQDHIFEHREFELHWDLDEAWKDLKSGKKSLVHIYIYNRITDYVAECAPLLGASISETEQFSNTITKDVNKILKKEM